MPKNGTEKVTIYLPSNLARRLRVAAALSRISQGGLVARGLEKELPLHEPKDGQESGQAEGGEER